MTSSADELRTQARRQALLQAIQAGLEAPRNNSRKWDKLYEWFASELKVGEAQGGGETIGKVITAKKQIGNRLDEMAKSDPRYAVIALLEGVDSDSVLAAMRKRGRLPALEFVFFLNGTMPGRLVVFGD